MKRVIVTGSAGNLGSKAVSALMRQGCWEVVGMDRVTNGDPGQVKADLSVYDAQWAQYFQGADAVLHLAGDAGHEAAWPSLLPLNIDLPLNVFRAAEDARVRRLVFGSSNWVLAGYRFRKENLTSALPPRPLKLYGATKLFIERYGESVAMRTGMSILNLRIGYCQPGENRPGAHMHFGRWGQEKWLGNSDWEQAVCKSVVSPYTGHATLNIVSNNRGMRWDLEEARRVIGYEPTEHHTPVLNFSRKTTDLAARVRDRLFPRHAATPFFGNLW